MSSPIQLIIMLVFGGICAAIATSRGRSGIGWFFVGLLFGCFGLILLLVLPDLKVLEERHQSLTRENRRLREMVRKDRTVADQRHGESVRRMGAHDRALGLDTSHDPQAIGGQSPMDAPPPLPAEESTDFRRVAWHYIGQGGQQGPVEFGTLKTLWKAGRLPPGACVWSDGMEEWLPIRDVRGMESALNA